MKDQAKQNWRQVIRKLKSARKKRDKLTKKIEKTPKTHTIIIGNLLEELRDINITISVLELKSDRLRTEAMK